MDEKSDFKELGNDNNVSRNKPLIGESLQKRK